MKTPISLYRKKTGVLAGTEWKDISVNFIGTLSKTFRIPQRRASHEFRGHLENFRSFRNRKTLLFGQ